MGILNQAGIKEDQFRLIVDVLLNIPYSQDYETKLISQIAQSNQANNDIIVTNGVHFSQFDSFGQYHFNVIINNRGRLDNLVRHVYVDPFLVDVENGGIDVDANDSVTLGCSNYWVYIFKSITI